MRLLVKLGTFFIAALVVVIADALPDAGFRWDTFCLL
jgi:hypothetical protein